MDLATLGLTVDGTGAIRTLDRFSASSDRATRSGDAVERMTRRVQAGLAALGLALGARQMAQYADTWKLIEGRLSLVTSSTAELATVQARVFKLANDSRGAFDATADLYLKMARNGAALAASHEDMLEVTEAVAKGFTISGASAESARASIIQLGQAMGSGTLRGDELNSVMEQAPRLAEAIAQGMGTTIQQLRKLGSEGKLTSQEVFKAIQSQTDVIRKEFEKTPVTIGQSMQVMENRIMRFVGQVDRATGVSGAFSRSILSLSDNLVVVAALIGAAATAWVAYQVATRAAVTWNALVAGAQTIQAFFQLARMIRSAADAMALFQMLGKGAIGVVAAVAAATVGFLAYRKLLSEIEAETQKWADSQADLTKKLGNGTTMVTELTAEQKAKLEAEKRRRAQNEDMVREAGQSIEVARLSGLAQKELQIRYDAVNKAIDARRQFTGALLRETEAAIEKERDLSLEAARVADAVEQANKKLEHEQEVLRNFNEQMQRTFSESFSQILSDGIRSFGDLFSAIRHMFTRMIADMAAAEAMRRWGKALAGALAGVFGGVTGTAATAVAQTATSTAAGIAADGVFRGADGELVPVRVEGISNEVNSSLQQMFAKAAPYLATALAAYSVGGLVGGTTSNRAVGAAGGMAAGAATGAILGSILPGIGTVIGAGVGAVAGALGGFLSASKRRAEEEARTREVLDRNNEALVALRLSMDRMGRVSGDSLTAAGRLAARLATVLRPGGSGIDALGAGDLEKAFVGKSSDPRIASLTSTYGMSLQALASIAKQVGIVLFDSAGKLVPQAFDQLVQAVGLTARALTTWGDSLDEVRARQNAYNKLFDVEDTPLNKLGDSYAVLRQMAPELLRSLGLDNLDLSAAADRDLLLGGLRDIYGMIENGTLGAELLGAFADKGQLIDVVLAAKDGLDAFRSSLAKVTTDFPRAMDVVLYEQKYGAGTGGGTAPRTSLDIGKPADARGGWVVQGDLVIQASDRESGEEILRKVEGAAQRRAAHGGFTYMPNTRVAE